MRALRRRRYRWPLEIVGVLLVIPFALLFVNAQRTCRSETFGLPANCNADWIAAVIVLAGLVVLAAEIAVPVRRRLQSRPCPRCGGRVANGRLECEACGFDFRAVGARNDVSPARRTA